MRTSVEDQATAATRRTLLRAAGVGTASLIGYALSGCGLFGDRTEPPPAPDPLAPLLADAVAMIGRYDAALAAYPALSERLGPVREAHVAHAAALARLLGVPAPGGGPSTGAPAASTGAPATSPADQKSTLAALRAAEQAGQRRAAQACLTAPPARAAVVGSIAAARATHLEVVR